MSGYYICKHSAEFKNFSVIAKNYLVVKCIEKENIGVQVMMINPVGSYNSAKAMNFTSHKHNSKKPSSKHVDHPPVYKDSHKEYKKPHSGAGYILVPVTAATLSILAGSSLTSCGPGENPYVPDDTTTIPIDTTDTVPNDTIIIDSVMKSPMQYKMAKQNEILGIEPVYKSAVKSAGYGITKGDMIKYSCYYPGNNAYDTMYLKSVGKDSLRYEGHRKDVETGLDNEIAWVFTNTDSGYYRQEYTKAIDDGEWFPGTKYLYIILDDKIVRYGIKSDGTRKSGYCTMTAGGNNSIKEEYSTGVTGYIEDVVAVIQD